MRQNNKSDHLMAMLSVWGIILVVMGHSGFTSPQIADRLALLHQWIYSFHMPLFFFISGYLYSLTNRDLYAIGNRRFMIKKFDRLLVPYFVLGVIIFVIKYAFAGLSTAERSFSAESFLYMFVAPHSADSTMGFLWYLITLFLVFAFVRLLSLLHIDIRSTATAVTLIMISWIAAYCMPDVELFNFSGLTWYFPFFVIGILFQTHFRSRPPVRINGIILPAGACIFFGIVLSLCFVTLPRATFLIRILAAMSGLCGSLFLCQWLVGKDWAYRHILPFSSATYSIYLLSWFGQYPVQILSINVLHLEWAISFPLIFAAGILLPLAVRWVITKSTQLRDCRFLILSIGY